MIIIIPEKLTPINAVNFSNFIGQIDGCNEDGFIYDFKEMQHCRPFGLLVIASAIRENIHRFPQCKHTIINPQMTQGGRFAAYSGFYKSIGFDIGYSKEETGDRFIPIREITTKELHEQYTNTTVLNDKVNWYSRILSNTLVGGQPNEVIDAIQYCFREIIRNTFEHGKNQ